MPASACRVLHCFRAPVGGLFRHVRDLARGQVELGLDVGLLCDATTGGAHAETQLDALGRICALGVKRLPMQRGPHPSDVAVLRSAAVRCRELHPDIIHGHGAKGGAYARLVGARLGVPAIYTPHGGTLHYGTTTPLGISYLLMERALRSRTDGYVFESQFSAREFAAKVGCPGAPQRVVHNGIPDAELAAPACSRAQPDKDFVFVGELRRLKGIETLIDAITQVCRQRDVTVLIAGAGPDASRFEAQVERLNLSTSVEFVPPVYPAIRAFTQGRCVVVPSWQESLPYVVLEAAGAGIPLLATRVGGIPEIFGSLSENLIAPRDPRALADAMLAVLDDPAGTQRNARLLQDRVARHFRSDAMVRSTCDFYRAILAER